MTRKWYVDVPIPDGLCGVWGCVFLYGHRGLHSWAPKPKGRQS